MNEILIAVFLSLAIAVSTLILVLVCLNLYEIFEEPEIEKRMRQLRKSAQPWVSVLVYARDAEDSIIATLNALSKNSYVKYDIVVIQDRSKDATTQYVEKFIKTHPKTNITLHTRRSKGTTKAALETAYKKSKKGKIVVSLRSGVIVPSDFIKRAVATKNDSELVKMKIPRAALMSSISDITQTLSSLLWREAQSIYVSDAKHITPTNLEVKLDIFSSLLFLGIISVSILTNEAIIIWYCWLLVTGYLFAVIWIRNEGLMIKSKLTFSAISALFLLPISSLIQGISQFRTRI